MPRPVRHGCRRRCAVASAAAVAFGIIQSSLHWAWTKAKGGRLTLHRSAEVAGPHPLKDAQAELDAAVDAAYGKPADQEATGFLLEMNLALARDEAAGETIQGPGLPKVDGEEVDPRDPRWFSLDCIEPPRLPG